MSIYEFKGTERFEVRGRLGSGTSGTVYRVFDRKQGVEVALKTLHKTEPSTIYRFKKEFRALADVNHPNLVQLYELLSEAGRWFFTMELVEGLDFLDYARSQPPVEDYGTGRFYSVPTPTAPADPERLRMALRQLAEGLANLHRRGMLHCDIKPSNMRVTADDRLVILDFGLVREVTKSYLYETQGGDVAGTPAYMSPEQASGTGMSPASDWYGVGVVLYEALTGRLPYRGGFLKMLADKQKVDPTPPREIVPDIPGDLAALCLSLLARDPDERPRGQDVLSILGVSQEALDGSHQSHSTLGGGVSPFVGRDELLAELTDAFAATRQGSTEVVLIHGLTGMGKTALLRRFLEGVRHEHPMAVLLEGRCYARESVPYKALDSLVDTLSRYLRQLPEQEAEVLMPTNVLALARLFPTLRRVQTVARARRRVLEIPDSQEQRRRAFAAFRELFSRLAERQPLVLAIDDLQWGDADSGSLLAELLQPPDPPRLMLVGCYRREEGEASALLPNLLSGKQLSGIRHRLLPVDELNAGEAKELAVELLNVGPGTAALPGSATGALAETIAQESAGSPFFIDELVRYAKAAAGLDREGNRSLSTEVEKALAEHMSMDRLVQARLEALPAEARRLLSVVAVAGRPLALEAVRQAADLGTETQATLALLRGASLARLRRGRGGGEDIDTYHERIRQLVLEGLPTEARRTLHRRLAQALESLERSDPETLAFHFRKAGESRRAAEFSVAAAERAVRALAFDQAARLFQLALDLKVLGNEQRQPLAVKLGDALANAGRGPEAANAYLAAAESAKTAEALELRRRAAEQQLISGHIDEGLATIRAVLESIGMRLPATPRRALASLLWWLLRLKLRGLRFRERDSTQIAADKLIAIDTCWSVSIGLGTVDTIRGIGFGKRHLLLALEAGEPYRVARALAIEAGYSGTGGRASAARTARLVQDSLALAERVNHPHAIGLANLTAGMAAYLEGEWRRAIQLLGRSRRTLREHCTGVTWELDTTMAYELRAQLFSGQLREVSQRLPRYLKDVKDRGDLYAETNLRSRISWFVLLMAHLPGQAAVEADAAIGSWSQEGFHVQHYWHLTGKLEIELYRDRPMVAWSLLEETWPRLADSLLLRIELTRTEALQLRCRCALAALANGDLDTTQKRRLRRLIKGDLRRIETADLSWANPLAALIRAGLATVEGDTPLAINLLVEAATQFDAADMALHAAASRHRRGDLLQEDGPGFRHQAREWLQEQGVKRPERLLRVLAPGRWGEEEAISARVPLGTTEPASRFS